MSSAMNSNDLLLKAASLVEEGWIQGAYHDQDDVTKEIIASCAIGAMERANKMLFNMSTGFVGTAYGAARRRLAEYVKPSLPKEIETSNDQTIVTVWNDAEERTAHEVAEAMRKVATDDL